MTDQDKKIMILYSLYLLLGGISLYKFLDLLARAIVHSEDYNNTYYISIALFLIAGLILIFASYGLLKNRGDPKYLGLVGIIILTTALTAFLYSLYTVNTDIEIIRHIHNYFVLIVSFIAFVLTIIYWKKLPWYQ